MCSHQAVMVLDWQSSSILFAPKNMRKEESKETACLRL